PEEEQNRQHPGQEIAEEMALDLAAEGDAVLVELPDQLLIVDAGRDELGLAVLLRRLVGALDIVGADPDVGDPAVLQLVLKLAVGNDLDPLGLRVEDLQQQDPEDRRNEVPGVVLRFLVHGLPPLGRPPARTALSVNTAKSRRLRSMNALID